MREKELIVRVMCLSVMLLPISCFPSSESAATSEEESDTRSSHHRQKRLFWITNDGRIALPPGTIMTITPTIALPFVRYPPHGFLSNMTISLPFTIDFDKLGLTDNENPYGTLPTAFDARSSSSSESNGAREAGALMGDLVAAFLKARSRKRELSDDIVKQIFQAFHGGERAVLYGTAEEILATFGLNGRACLLRAICEVHGHPLSNFGLIGEILKLFLTASKSPFANLLEEYVQAEKRGQFHGECWPYFKDCPKSLFLSASNKYLNELSTKATHSEFQGATFSHQKSFVMSSVDLNRERAQSRHSAM